MASGKGKSLKLKQALLNLEDAINEWDGIQPEPLKSTPDPRRERTIQLLKELKQQLEDFNEEGSPLDSE